MIGNDVIDLTLAKVESNWQRTGYLDKIFTENEKQFIQKASDKTETVWHLWSRKEAVYKIILQQNGRRGYYPLKIETIDFENGIVRFGNQIYFTKSYSENNCIHTVALTTNNFEDVIDVFYPYKLLKFKSIPYLMVDEKYYHASKSHHGQFEKVVMRHVF